MKNVEKCSITGKIQTLNISEVFIPQEMKNLYDYTNRENEIDTLKTSIKEFGQLQPVLGVKENDKIFIINGVLRYEALIRLEKNEIDVILVDFNFEGESFTLEDLIIHSQIQKVKTAQEKFREFVTILRIDSGDSNPLRDRNLRYNFLSTSLGKGWSRSNVIKMINVIKWTMENGDDLKIAEKVFNNEILVSEAEFGVKVLSREDYGLEQEKELKALKLFFNGKIKVNDVLFALETLARPDYSYESEKNLKALKFYFNRVINKNDVNKHIHEYNEKMGLSFTNVQFSGYKSDKYLIIPGDVLSNPLPSEVLVDLCLTSVPYWQQVKYGSSALEIGREKTPEQYVNNICSIFSNNIDQIKDSGVIVVNINESFKDGQCVGVVPMFILEMKKRGFLYIQTCIWDKNKTGKPSGGKSVRRLGNQFEYILIFTKKVDYYFNPIRLKNDKKTCKVTKNCKEQSNNVGTHVSNRYDSVYDLLSENSTSDILLLNQTSSRSQSEFGMNFFGSFPTLFPVPFILTFSPENGVVWDPCGGSGTVGRQSLFLGRSTIISELYDKNVKNISKLLEEGVNSFNNDEFQSLNERLGYNTIELVNYELVA